jgi:hypothetical protein
MRNFLAGQPRGSAVSFVIPTNDDDRVVGCVQHLTSYIQRRGLNAEIIVSGCLGSASLTSNSRYIPVVPASKGNAIRAGIWASNGQSICLCDADMRVAFAELDTLLYALKQAEVVLGDRVHSDSVCVAYPPLRRRMASATYRWLVQRLFGLEGMDTQFGLKAFRRSAALRLSSAPLVHGFGFDVELVLRARMFGYRVVNCPVQWGWCPQSTIRLHRVVPSMLLELVYLWSFVGGRITPRRDIFTRRNCC